MSFTPHMFVNLYQYKLNEEYNISYLTHHELFDYRHKLYSASEDITFETLSNMFDLKTINKMRYCCTSKIAIIQFEQV